VKDIDQLAHDMRVDSDLLDAVAMTLAVSPPGDWSALTDRLSALGYGVSADELQDKLRSIHEPGAPHAELITHWL
jgi:hypothetical protein